RRRHATAGRARRGQPRAAVPDPRHSAVAVVGLPPGTDHAQPARGPGRGSPGSRAPERLRAPHAAVRRSGPPRPVAAAAAATPTITHAEGPRTAAPANRAEPGEVGGGEVGAAGRIGEAPAPVVEVARIRLGPGEQPPRTEASIDGAGVPREPEGGR